ncbi:Alginate biosynthesis sensor protein KinB [compost metagenome]
MSASREFDTLAQTLLTHVSNELRTSLSVFKSTIPLLSEQIIGPLNEKQQAYLRILSTSAQSLSTMVNDLLTMAEVQAGQTQLVLQPVDFPHLVRLAIRAFEPVARANGQILCDEVDPALPAFRGDVKKIERILNGLIDNALGSTQAGGLIRLQARAHDGMLEVAIRDTGHDFTDEEQAMLFQAFGRLYPDRAQGLGLGLPISRAFVEAHGGTLQIESQPGLGSYCRFTLPLIPLAPEDPLPWRDPVAR